jgi:three-Cys-motif partner protein
MEPFFQKKREWSKCKDSILKYYLEPYVPKVNKLKKRILIIDCFAGRGEFGDGKPGSPLIISSIVRKWRDKGVPIQGIFIEANRENYNHLCRVLEEHRDYAEPRFGTFDEHLPEIARQARQNTVFLYVDPYSVRGLIFERMKAVYDQIRTSSASVEVLLNLNADAFMRWALPALQRSQDVPDEVDDEEFSQPEDTSRETVELDSLNAIAGGDYWRSIAVDPALGYSQKLEHFTSAYKEKMQSSFPFVASCEIKAKYDHKVPKYYLVYATRHRDGLELINDAMCKARDDFLGKEFKRGFLFDCTPEKEMPDLSALKRDLLAVAVKEGSLSRKALRLKGLLAHFGRFKIKHYNAAITELLKEGTLTSSTGKTTINDDVILSPVEPT